MGLNGMDSFAYGIRIIFSIVGLGLGNACFYELMNGDCYELKTISHYISFSVITIGCNLGYFFVASPLSDRYRRLAVVLLLPAVLVTPMFLSSWFKIGQYVAYLSAISAVLFVYRERVSNALGSLERKKRS